jgi:hypothetical protein
MLEYMLEHMPDGADTVRPVLWQMVLDSIMLPWFCINYRYLGIDFTLIYDLKRISRE